MSLYQPKAVIFDFDGVLADTMKDNFKSWENTLAKYKKSLIEIEYYPLEGLPLLEIAKKFCQDKKIDQKFAERMVHEKEKNYLANYKIKFFKGVEDLVDKLFRKKAKLAIVSAGSEKRLRKTVPWGFLKKFDVVIYGDNLRRGKPFPDGYRQANKLLSVKPNETVVVENSPLGIEAAKAAGCYCVAITSTLDRRFLQKADKIINSFADLDQLEQIKSLIS